MGFVDTNILLRWLLSDHGELTKKARLLIEKAKPDSLLITMPIMAEVVYVLRSKGYDIEQTTEALSSLDRVDALKYEQEELAQGIIGLLGTKLDFADCYLLARARRESRTLHTFDKALQKELL